jgi:hypothetical protein
VDKIAELQKLGADLQEQYGLPTIAGEQAGGPLGGWGGNVALRTGQGSRWHSGSTEALCMCVFGTPA